MTRRDDAVQGVVDGLPRVTISVPTFRRTSQLSLLLGRLVEQSNSARLETAARIRILVIDNDPECSALQVVAQLDHRRLRYVHEPRPGVVAVRNRALQECRAEDVMIFIDDDQLPTIGWLNAMLSMWKDNSGAAVAGPVISELPHDADGWIRDGGFFDRRYRRGLTTGTRITEVATTNLLLDVTAISAIGITFDEEFGMSGGEDSLFTRSLTRAGCPIVWCVEAAVVEPVPAHRLTRAWVCARAISSGNSQARVDLALATSRRRRAVVRTRLVAAGGARLAGGSFRLLTGRLRGSDSRHSRGVRTALRGLGMVFGAAGLSYLEYSRGGRRWSWRSRLSAQ